MRVDRRSALGGTLALVGTACLPYDHSITARLSAKLRVIEAGIGGTLGVSILAATRFQTFDQVLGHKNNLRFPICSTFKTSLAALVLALDQEGRLDASEWITWKDKDLVPYRPFVDARGNAGASLMELARAAQTLSDNSAANLLLARVGGPEALTRFWRSLGDDTSRLDRIEPELNYVPQGEMRDTTTPLAMAKTLQTLLFKEGGPLSVSRQTLLRQWMRETPTGIARVRAGLGENIVAGDKTGTSGEWPKMGYARGDIGFVLSDQESPIIFAVYHQAKPHAPPTAEQANHAFAEIGQVIRDYMAYSASAPAT